MASNLPRNWRRAIAVAVASWAAISHAAASPQTVPSVSAPDPYCGPRCVQYVLKHYGQRAELVDLIREMQWPRIEAGSTLAAIDAALRKRGICTFAARLPRGSSLNWRQPAIVHFAPQTKESLGHFVTWLPSSTPHRIDYWDGLSGTKVASSSDFVAATVDAILLTSDSPITATPSAVVSSAGIDVAWWIVVGIALAVALTLLPIVRSCYLFSSTNTRRTL